MKLLRHLLFLLALAPGLAMAQPADPFADLTGSGFDDIRRGIEALAVSGHPQAVATITALQASTLLAAPPLDGKVGSLVIKHGDTLIDARTGKPADGVAAAALRPVRVNNAVRRAAEAAMGSLTLFSVNDAERRKAAETVFKSRDPAGVPALTRALAAEKNAAIRAIMEQARAAALLATTDASEADRIAAVATLRARGDLDTRGLLASLKDQPAAVVTAAADAVTAIDRQQQMWSVVQGAFYGLSLGSVLLLAAAGLAITFGVMGVINMAHGEMVMIGAYTTFVVQEVIRARYPALFDYSLALAIPLAFLVAGAIGVAIERGIIRYLYGRPLETLLATWGISLILQQAVRTIFGPTNRQVGSPSFMSGSIDIGNLSITYNRFWIIIFALFVFMMLIVVLKYTPFGLQMRAVTQNRPMASAMGIRTPWVDAMTFGLGSGVAGMAGVALSQIDNVSPNLGQSFIIDSFMVVVFGGVGNLWGTLVGAFSLGIANKFLEPYAGAVLGKILVLVFIILFIQKRPRGLFALKGRAVEA